RLQIQGFVGKGRRAPDPAQRQHDLSDHDGPQGPGGDDPVSHATSPSDATDPTLTTTPAVSGSGSRTSSAPFLLVVQLCLSNVTVPTMRTIRARTTPDQIADSGRISMRSTRSCHVSSLRWKHRVRRAFGTDMISRMNAARTATSAPSGHKAVSSP